MSMYNNMSATRPGPSLLDAPQDDYFNYNNNESPNTPSSLANPITPAGTEDLGFWDKGGALDTGMGTFGKMAGGVSSLANVYLGFQNLDMAKEKMGIYREQWDMAKQELKHMQGTRAAITKQFSGK